MREKFSIQHILPLTKTDLAQLQRDWGDIDGLVQDCSNYIANALELLQSCTKPSIYQLVSRLTSYMDGLVQDCSISIALAMEIL